MKFLGYTRPDGQVGVRNHLLVLPSVVCANDTALRIAAQLVGAVSVTHPHGCSQLTADAQQTCRTLTNYALNPNVGAVIVVGLGCETVRAQDLAQDIAQSGKPVACLIIQEEGGTLKTIAKGVNIGRQFFEQLSQMKREEHDVSEIILGLECGGSDSGSGISANPAAGYVSDRLVSLGGTAILSETQEVIGAEHLLAARAADAAIGQQLLDTVRGVEKEVLRYGVDIRLANPTPGNKEGGITTLEEKSLGCLYKAGTSSLQEVLDYAQRPSRKGLVFMNTPGHDAESITGELAGGAQVIIFTTGRGSCVGASIAPVIKVSSNTATYERMQDNMDINAGQVLDGKLSIAQMGELIWQELLEVINGKVTKAEVMGYDCFAINRIAPTQ